jgi:hypothetical protein
VGTPINHLLWGALAMSAFVASLFFFRFWRISRDRLFLFFCVAFLMLALNWLGLALVESVTESRHKVLLLRLAAFVSIIIGVVDKNRRARSAADDIAGEASN